MPENMQIFYNIIFDWSIVTLLPELFRHIYATSYIFTLQDLRIISSMKQYNMKRLFTAIWYVQAV